MNAAVGTMLSGTRDIRETIVPEYTEIHSPHQNASQGATGYVSVLSCFCMNQEWGEMRHAGIFAAACFA